MDKVTTELEALDFCKEYGCRLEFIRKSNNTPAHVILRLGICLDVLGKDLVEAVNRIVDMYHTAPNDYEKLDWWKDYKYFYANHMYSK